MCFLKRFFTSWVHVLPVGISAKFFEPFCFFLLTKKYYACLLDLCRPIFFIKLLMYGVFQYTYTVYDYSLCLQLAEINLQFFSLMNTLRECNSSVLAKLYPMCTSILFTYHSQVKLWRKKRNKQNKLPCLSHN